MLPWGQNYVWPPPRHATADEREHLLKGCFHPRKTTKINSWTLWLQSFCLNSTTTSPTSLTSMEPLHPVEILEQLNFDHFSLVAKNPSVLRLRSRIASFQELG